MNRPQICQLILSLLSSVAYIKKLYKNDSDEQARERSKHYLDLYLNTPEKGVRIIVYKVYFKITD